jgi:molybdopterin converting factor small subunit
MEAYHKAESDEDRNAAKGGLQSELETQYDAFIDQQGKQVEELEERLAKLKEQLQKRREAKSRMVDLKLQMVLSQADGLGWPEPQHRGNPFYGQAVGPAGQPLETRRVPGIHAPSGFVPDQVPTPGQPSDPRERRQPGEPRAPRGAR